MSAVDHRGRTRVSPESARAANTRRPTTPSGSGSPRARFPWQLAARAHRRHLARPESHTGARGAAAARGRGRGRARAEPGARVFDWSPEDIDEAYRLRALIEGYGAGLAARRADVATVDGSRAAGPLRGRARPRRLRRDAGAVQRRLPRRRARRLGERAARHAVVRGLERPARPAGTRRLRHRRPAAQRRGSTATSSPRSRTATRAPTSAMSSHILAARYSARCAAP